MIFKSFDSGVVKSSLDGIVVVPWYGRSNIHGYDILEALLICRSRYGEWFWWRELVTRFVDPMMEEITLCDGSSTLSTAAWTVQAATVNLKDGSVIPQQTLLEGSNRMVKGTTQVATTMISLLSLL